jgi:hypothetical protein
VPRIASRMLLPSRWRGGLRVTASKGDRTSGASERTARARREWAVRGTVPAMADQDDTISVALRIPRSAFTMHAPPPELLSQKNVLAVCGLPPRRYLETLRIAPLPVTRVGRLRLVDRASFVEWIKSRAEATVGRGASAKPVLAEVAGNVTASPVEVLARKLGAQVSPELAEAAAKEARDDEARWASLLKDANLVATRPRDPENDLKTARLMNKWAAGAIGDRNAYERFARELGQQPCPTCPEWTEHPPCTSCKTKARLAARVPCRACEKLIDPCKDGLCRACRKAAKTAVTNAPHEAGTRRRSRGLASR